MSLSLHSLLLVRLFGDEVQLKETLAVVEHCLGILTHRGQTHLYVRVCVCVCVCVCKGEMICCKT